MFVKRKDWEELNDKICYLEDKLNRISNNVYRNKDTIEKLCRLHKNKKAYSLTVMQNGEEYYFDYECDPYIIGHVVKVNNIGEISLQELAEYVINHKPIVRDKTIKVEYRNED